MGELLATDTQSERPFRVVGVHNGDAAPTMLRRDGHVIYGRLQTHSTNVAVSCRTQTLLLYDEESLLLLGRVEALNGHN